MLRLPQKISVIIPVYNCTQTLCETVKSIQIQTYSNIEIVLINDGSTDDSGKCCDSLAQEDDRIKVIHQRNLGVSAARNVGIEKASGDYIGFVDADDLIDIDMYETLFQLLEGNCANMSRVFAREIYNGKNLSKQLSKQTQVLESQVAINAYLYGRLRYSANTSLYTKELLCDIRFNEKLKCSEDYLFVYQCITKSSFIAVCYSYKYTYNKRELNMDTLTIFFQRQHDIIQVHTIVTNDIKKNFPLLSEQANLLLLRPYFDLIRIIFKTKGARKKYKKNVLFMINEIHELRRTNSIHRKFLRMELFSIRYLPRLYAFVLLMNIFKKTLITDFRTTQKHKIT